MTDSPRIHAPELTGGTDWFNVPAPISLASLRGKVVLLDFWTYGCINCMHILPDLRRLEERYREELVVIGIHSAKFSNERKSENIRRILVRYDIDHPVVNDGSFAIWKAYGTRAWPTQVLIDPEGYVVATASGEGKGQAFDEAIAAVIHFFDEQGKIDRTPIALSLERQRIKTSTLAFPGKVLADEAGGRLFVADSNHHRVLVTGFDGVVRDVIGGRLDAGDDAEVGDEDGSFEEARFYRPQGLALDGDILYVADTENHKVRAASLTGRRVTTLAGTGLQAGYGTAGGASRMTPLNSPWDLQLHGGILFVAMAGAHQIWMIDLMRQLAFPYAGSGREARVDGDLDDAAFAQPSGLSIADGTMYVADSESNIIRAIDLPPTNRVRTLAGGDLFEFGDRDGQGDAARFQHPLGIVAARGVLFVADTYNHRIRTVSPATGDVRVFAGMGVEGHDDGPAAVAQFHEPGGLSATSDALWVSDTNNHAIRRVALSNGECSTLVLRIPV
ncbi:MAG: thioredoxin-like domain-containing protein [Acidobacteriota bacterium]